MPVDILLATYQGEKHLREQIESILKQTWGEFSLFIRDDGSRDKTKIILKEFAAYDSRIQLLENLEGRLGPKGNFGKLLEASKGDYIFFADQDDRWHPAKLEKMRECLKRSEAQWGKETPLLVHSNLEVVDGEGKMIHPSFWEYSGFNPSRAATLHRLLVQNCVTGCAMAFNAALRKRVGFIPPRATMHDAWLALVAARFGHIETIQIPLISYRQHGKNVVGAKRYRVWNFLKQGWKKIGQKNTATLEQAKVFKELFGPHEIVDAFLALPEKNFFKSRYQILKYKFYKQGFLRNLAHFLLPYE